MECYNVWNVTAWHNGGYAVSLGYYEGYIDHLAFQLFKDSYTYLYFEPVVIQTIGYNNLPAKYANISVPFSIGGSVDLFTHVQELVSKGITNAEVFRCPEDRRYVTIRRPLTTEELADEKLQELLAKFSDKEKRRLLKLLNDEYGAEVND